MSNEDHMAKSIFDGVQAMIAKARREDAETIAVLTKQIAELQARIESMPPPKDGKDGVDGRDGEKGADGLNGKDAFEIAAEEGFKGSRSEWVKSLEGANGIDGRDGRDGGPGPRGKDAIEIDVLPALDPEKSYPRGTFASHKGGLWRAHTATEGMRGWECIVDGVAEIAPEFVGERGIKLAVTLASGKTKSIDAKVPVAIYRGVFTEGKTYDPGDVVTWGGSMWHCDEASASKPGEPGTKGWTLSVKRGAAGKDGQLLAPREHKPVKL